MAASTGVEPIVIYGFARIVTLICDTSSFSACTSRERSRYACAARKVWPLTRVLPPTLVPGA